ncbi:SixA phosphatase family protein [Luteococcus sp. Sow4_B9]|uniref:SixA phosphatase family protein n=1 Tax=Luteococcus sp. Sow4_B9 TaxID=3438792 RepID=UPI003F97FF35
MTRTLVLMRHAAAEGWSADGDKGRVLSAAGREEARMAGLELAGLGIQHVLCSTSARTRETFEQLGLDVPVEYMDALYNSGDQTILQRIGEIDDEITGLLVIGHAPGIPGLASELSWVADAKAADDMRCWFPTGTFTQFTLEGSWQDLADDQTVSLTQIRRVGN